ncbi:peptidase family C78-domain-containing protein [Jimgerdemannia flammicorona]|uniref:Peptidase family C78-domain-containing protein n=1 Tax=Jimgerdemannia flammicorona TaxID=994334 RepID=A0A433D3M8_9FUNG|nr:peptidase family C78-domain-containing protein [Jimgerdemannia flammicorona]
MTSALDCPICNQHIIGDDATLNFHVNQHFPQSPPHPSSTPHSLNNVAKISEHGQCPVCEKRVTNVEAHVASHFGGEGCNADEDGAEEKVQCEVENCRKFVSLSDLQIHLDAHHAETLVRDERQSLESLKRKELTPDTLAAPNSKRANTEKNSEAMRGGNDAWQIKVEELIAGVGQIQARGKAMREAKEVRVACLIPKLCHLLTRSHARATGPYSTRSAFLCSPLVAHLASDISDAGWGCGYRNCQMILSYIAALPGVGGRLGIAGRVPDVAGLQAVLEEAWADGFDPTGAKQLKWRVVKTRRWIGTTEVYAILTYLGVRCTVIDFHKPTGPTKFHNLLFDWITAYFTPFTSTPTSALAALTVAHIRTTRRAPLYLQHQGHSRTCVGIERTVSDERNLILFDPSRRIWRDMSTLKVPEAARNKENAAGSAANGKKPVGFAGLSFAPAASPDRLLGPYRNAQKTVAKHAQYQVLALGDWDSQGRAVGGENDGEEGNWLVLSEEERYARKEPRFVRVP